MRNHLNWHEVLVAQGVPAMMVGIHQIEKCLAWILVFDLFAPVHCLLGDQGRIDQDDTFFSMDKARGTAAIVVVDKNAGGQLFALTQAGHTNSHRTSTSCHLS